MGSSKIYEPARARFPMQCRNNLVTCRKCLFHANGRQSGWKTKDRRLYLHLLLETERLREGLQNEVWKTEKRENPVLPFRYKREYCDYHGSSSTKWMYLSGPKEDATLKQTTRILLLVPMIVLFLGCQKQQPDWPNRVSASMWIDRKAKHIERQMLSGTYQIQYTVAECYPGKQFLQDMKQSMTDMGWKRLEYDFLNPSVQTSHGRAPGGLWSHIINSDGKEAYIWIDDWEDSEKNIVRYSLKYQGENASSLEKSCDLEVIIIYTPKEIR